MAISDKSTDKERQVLQETTKCKISEQSQKKLSAWDRSLNAKVKRESDSKMVSKKRFGS